MPKAGEGAGVKAVRAALGGFRSTNDARLPPEWEELPKADRPLDGRGGKSRSSGRLLHARGLARRAGAPEDASNIARVKATYGYRNKRRASVLVNNLAGALTTNRTDSVLGRVYRAFVRFCQRGSGLLNPLPPDWGGLRDVSTRGFLTTMLPARC